MKKIKILKNKIDTIDDLDNGIQLLHNLNDVKGGELGCIGRIVSDIPGNDDCKIKWGDDDDFCISYTNCSGYRNN